MMGLKDYSQHTFQEVTWEKIIGMVDKRYLNIFFEWDKIVSNLPGTEAYDCCQPWFYKMIIFGHIDADLFLCIHDVCLVGLNEDVCWKESSIWCEACTWLGIKYASRKVQIP